MRSDSPPTATRLPLKTALTAGCCMLALDFAAAAPDATDVSPSSVEEVVVTAQRREEQINDVPITISAFDADSLRNAGARGLEDVATMVPNAQIFQNNGTGAPTWIIRGVGVVDFNTNNTPASAIYLDDIYQTSSVFGSIALFDIERVEVLKGPQGGLYGRNTSGGAVRVITRSPSLTESEGSLTTSYGRWGRMKSDAAVSLPLIDDALAVRLSGRMEKSSEGWQYSIPAQQKHGKLDSYAVRAQVLAQPSESLKIRAILDAGQDDSEIVSPRALGLYSPAGGFCAEVRAGYGSDNCLTWQQLTTGSGLSPNLQSEDATRVLADPFGRNDNDTLGATLIADIGIGEMTLTSVSGYRDFDFGQMQESDGIPGEFGHQVSGSFFKSYSQEFRLASSPDGALTWIIGANYARDTLEERRKFLARDNAAYAAIFGSPLILGLNYDQESKAWATYGQADYALTDTLTVSGALRYTQEEKSYTNGTISFPGVPNIFGTPLQDDYELDSPWSGKVSLGWKPVEDTLIYASVSRGFKSGGFFGGFALKGQAAIRPYTEELVNAYEIGTKNTFLDKRVGMNLSMFYYDYQDVQSFATEWDEILGTITRLRNVGDAEHVGVELESYVVPVEGLRLAASVGYLDAQIQDSPNNFRAPDGQLITYDGYQRVFAPEWSWTAQASYELPIGAAGSLRFAADANGRSTIINPGKLVSTGQESLVDRALHRIPGYKLVNGRISFQAADGDWEVALWGRNLLDESYKTVWGGDGLGSVWQLYGEPMSYGVEATLRW